MLNQGLVGDIAVLDEDGRVGKSVEGDDRAIYCVEIDEDLFELID